MPLFKTLHDTHGMKFKSLGKAPSLICLLPSSPASFLLLPISHTGEELPAVPWVLFYFPSSNFYIQFPQWNAFLPLISPAPQHALAAPETFPSIYLPFTYTLTLQSIPSFIYPPNHQPTHPLISSFIQLVSTELLLCVSHY